MMKNKTTKMLVNGAVFAAMAALGIAAFQLGTSPKDETDKIAEAPVEMVAENPVEPEADSMIDVGNSNVEASMESVPEEETEVTAALEEEDIEDGEEEVVDTSATILPKVNFSEETLMEWPVSGNILVDYSMDKTTYFPTLDQYRLSPAISVQAEQGTPVLAAANGTVALIEEKAQTGTTLTMDLGNGYQAVYGQLSDLMVSQGDTVAEGTILGYVGAPTKYYSTEGSNLYFAMSKDSEPIDPISYLP